MNIIKNLAAASLVALSGSLLVGCTNLDEELFSEVDSSNYYNTKLDVARAVLRPFEHAFWSIQSRHSLNEYSADQLITPSRDGWWDDSGRWRRLHYHEWNVEEGNEIYTEWRGCYQGIGQCNYVIEDMERLDPDKFGYTQAEFDNLKSQCRTLRAWFYLRLLDAFRNVPYVVSFNDQSKNTLSQVEPKKIFKFIEDELLDCLKLAGQKSSLGTQASLQGKWTKAGVAALLCRLYLNAKVYVGEDRLEDCETYAQNIVDGMYGPYEVADTWDAPFNWDNDTCDEVIFGFPATSGYSFWHYDMDMYTWTVPANSEDFFNDHKKKTRAHNCKWAASPSYDPTGELYNFELGMPVQKFRKYEGDVRMKCYKYLGTGQREGLFLYGALEYTDANGNTRRVKAPEQPYELYIRDAVGKFKDLAPDQWLSSKSSSLTEGDMNSGWHFVKYPLFPDSDPHQTESDYTEIRLPEIIYTLAECMLRRGETFEAGKLLNSVRKRNYPAENYEEVLYRPEGKVTLDEKELLDEWGREFFAEGRRRIDLIRFGKFSTGTWWDKSPDSDNHTEIFPLTRTILGANGELVQNPGYSN